jgi:CoA:oxalate CoA-transferase
MKARLSGLPKGPLSGLIVVDLTRVLAGPYVTLVLGDLGARIIKVEMPGTGDDTRGTGPFAASDDGTSTSGYFFSVNRNKESIALDLKKAEDREVFEALLSSADVLVENYRPGVMAKLGYDWDSVSRRWPGLVLASISGFGQTGPYADYPAYDMVVQAMGGVMSLTGPEGTNEPVRVGISIGDLAAGLFGAIGVQAALIERQKTGLGKHVDVAMMDCQVALLENALARFQIDGLAPKPLGSRHPSITPFAAFQAQDGHIVIAAGNDPMFRKLCAALDCEDLVDDPRFASNAARSDHADALRSALETRLAAKDCATWLDILRAAQLPCAPLNDMAAVFADPQIEARGMLVPLPLPGGGHLKVAGSPIRFAGDEPPDYRPAPTLDEHRDALLAELGLISANTRTKDQMTS